MIMLYLILITTTSFLIVLTKFESFLTKKNQNMVSTHKIDLKKILKTSQKRLIASQSKPRKGKDIKCD
jgi:hypothetical protein